MTNDSLIECVKAAITKAADDLEVMVTPMEADDYAKAAIAAMEGVYNPSSSDGSALGFTRCVNSKDDNLAPSANMEDASTRKDEVRVDAPDELPNGASPANIYETVRNWREEDQRREISDVATKDILDVEAIIRCGLLNAKNLPGMAFTEVMTQLRPYLRKREPVMSNLVLNPYTGKRDITAEGLVDMTDVVSRYAKETGQPDERTEAEVKRILAMTDDEVIAEIGGTENAEKVAAHVRRIFDKAKLQVSIAKTIHYPACWDTMAYPTLFDALHELAGCVGCSVCQYPGKNPDADQRPSERESVAPTEKMCDQARGFILGLDCGIRTWYAMDEHLCNGGYPTIPYIKEQAENNPDGHITKWDVADCIYQLMNTEIEGGN